MMSIQRKKRSIGMELVHVLVFFIVGVSDLSADINMVTDEISPQRHDIVFRSQGFIKAGQQTEISAQVSGEVIKLSEDFDTGKKVKQGELLFSVDSADYRALLATAKQNLADAALTLEDEKARSRRAKRNWGKTNTGKPGQLVGRDLHVAAAQARYNAEIVNVMKAERDVERTHVIAPYDGIVQRREISLGSFVQPGVSTGLLFKANSAVIDLPIFPRYLNHMKDLSRVNIALYGPASNTENPVSWSASAHSFSPALDTKDQRALLRADVHLHQDSPIFINQYMTAKITIPHEQLLFAIPLSAFTQRESILLLVNGVLDEMYPEVVYQYDNKKYARLSTNEAINVIIESPDFFWPGAKSKSLASVVDSAANSVTRAMAK